MQKYLYINTWSAISFPLVIVGKGRNVDLAFYGSMFGLYGTVRNAF
jgi:hypothetical protein